MVGWEAACAATTRQAAAGPRPLRHHALTIYLRYAVPDVIRDLRGWAEHQVRGARIAGLRATTLDAVEAIPV